MFANFFHTHLAGRFFLDLNIVLSLFHLSGYGMTLQHIRYNSECGVYEELEPIDNNMKYDFDYQQFTHLRHEVLIKPVNPFVPYSLMGFYCSYSSYRVILFS